MGDQIYAHRDDLRRGPVLGVGRAVRAGITFTLFLFAATTVAQTGAKDLGQASLEELTNIQVYSASKSVQNVSDAPSSVTVVTADEIQKYGYRTLADILQSVRGFYVTSDRDYSFVGVRGFGRLGDYNIRILVLIDGHRINDNTFGEAYLGTEFLLDVDLIERVEIIRGPSSSLYGADAFFAVINVITRKSRQLKGVELSFAPASFGTYQGRASYGGQYNGIDMLLSGTFYNSQGPTLFFPEFNSPATNNGITSHTDYESSQHIMASVSYRGFTLQGLFSARDKGVPTGYFGTVFNDPRTHTSVLSVGDTPSFAKAGGIINFVIDDNRVRFEINPKAAERAHLKLSARLLTVAKLIVTEEETQGK